MSKSDKMIILFSKKINIYCITQENILLRNALGM